MEIARVRASSGRHGIIEARAVFTSMSHGRKLH